MLPTIETLDDAIIDNPPSQVINRLHDVHCHPTDALDHQEYVFDFSHFTVCAMSTDKSNLFLVSQLAKRWPRNVIPAFG